MTGGTPVSIAPLYIDELVQERHNSSALAMELRLSCTNLSVCCMFWEMTLNAGTNLYIFYSLRPSDAYIRQ